MSKNFSRRALIRQGVAMGGAAMFFGALPVQLFAQPTSKHNLQASADSNAPRRIDVHHHILPPEYVNTVGSPIIGAPAGRPDAPPWSIESDLETMDKFGVETAITSISAPGIPLDDAKAVQRLARICNDYAKQMAMDHPKRFGLFATLPLPDVSISLEEIKYAFETLHADGIVLMTNYRDVYLGEAAYAPVFQELNSRKAVVFVHPTQCRCSVGVQPGIPTSLIEFPHDTTRTITSMLANGTFTSYPDIRFIFCHAGGTLPFLVNRIAGRYGLDNILPQLKRQYYDLAGSANPQAMGPLLSLVDVSHVLLGTDHPFAGREKEKAVLTGIANSSLDARSIRMIERDNALTLFPRIASPTP